MFNSRSFVMTPPTAEKPPFISESLSPGTTPAAVARRHAISSGLLYTWRQQLLAGQLAPVVRAAPSFAKIEIVGALGEVGWREQFASTQLTRCDAAGQADLAVIGTVEERLVDADVRPADGQSRTASTVA